jgi:hypothetical protein
MSLSARSRIQRAQGELGRGSEREGRNTIKSPKNVGFSPPIDGKAEAGRLRPFPFRETHHENQNAGNSSDRTVSRTPIRAAKTLSQARGTDTMSRSLHLVRLQDGFGFALPCPAQRRICFVTALTVAKAAISVRLEADVNLRQRKRTRKRTAEPDPKGTPQR